MRTRDIKRELSQDIRDIGYLLPNIKYTSRLDLENVLVARAQGAPLWLPTKTEVREAGRYYLSNRGLCRRTGNWTARCAIPTSAIMRMVEALCWRRYQRNFFLEGKNTMERSYLGACLSVLSIRTHDRVFFRKEVRSRQEVNSYRRRGIAAFENKCDEMTQLVREGIRNLSVSTLNNELNSRRLLDRINLVAAELRQAVVAMREREADDAVRQGWAAEEEYLETILAGNTALNPRDRITTRMTADVQLPQRGLQYSFQTDLTSSEMSLSIMSEISAGRHRAYNPEPFERERQAAPIIGRIDYGELLKEFGRTAARVRREGGLVPREVVEEFMRKTKSTMSMNGDMILSNGVMGLEARFIEPLPNEFVETQMGPPPPNMAQNPTFTDSNLIASQLVLENGLSAREAPTHMLMHNAAELYKKVSQENLDSVYLEEASTDMLLSIMRTNDGLDFNLLRGDMLLPTLDKYIEWHKESVIRGYLQRGAEGLSYKRILQKAPTSKPAYILPRLIEMLSVYVASDSGIRTIGKNYMTACYHCASFWKREYISIIDGGDQHTIRCDLGIRTLENAVHRYDVLLADNSPMMIMMYAEGGARDYEAAAEFIRDNNIRLAVQAPEIQATISNASFAGGVDRARLAEMPDELASNVAMFRLGAAMTKGNHYGAHLVVTDSEDWKEAPVEDLVKYLRLYAQRYTRPWAPVDLGLAHLIGVATMADQLNIGDFNRGEAVEWYVSLFKHREPDCELVTPDNLNRGARKKINKRVSAAMMSFTMRTEAHRAVAGLILEMSELLEHERSDRDKIKKRDYLMCTINRVFLVLASRLDVTSKGLATSAFSNLNTAVQNVDYLTFGHLAPLLNVDLVMTLNGFRESIKAKKFSMK